MSYLHVDYFKILRSTSTDYSVKIEHGISLAKCCSNCGMSKEEYVHSFFFGRDIDNSRRFCIIHKVWVADDNTCDRWDNHNFDYEVSDYFEHEM